MKANFTQLKRTNESPPKSEFGVRRTINDVLFLHTYSRGYLL